MNRTKLAIVAAGAAAVSLAVAPALAQASPAHPRPAAALTNPMLYGVTQTSATSGWAVGYSSNTTTQSQPLTMSWTGTKFNVVNSPNPGNFTQLTAVSADSSKDAWAVGHYFKPGSNVSQALLLHWNGTAWSQVASPDPGTAANTLSGVKAISPTDAWAVGSYQDSSTGSPTFTFILHWNGHSWTQTPSPSPTKNGVVLNSVSAISATDAWTVGTYASATGVPLTLALHWNGTTWSKVASPDVGPKGNALNGVSEVSAGNAWAVGYDITGGNVWQTLILHWTGTKWTKVPAPSPVGASAFPELNGVSAPSATDIWAAGSYYTSNGSQLVTLTLRYNGTTWSTVASPSNSADNENLQSVSAVSPTSALAVGHGRTGSLILHWTGTKWATVPTP